MPACFDKAEWPLREMRLTNFRGFLFLTDSNDTPPLEESLGNAPELALADWPLEDLVTVGRKSYKVECNWKFIMQNTSETYHTDFVHRDSLGPMHSEPIAKYTGVEPRGNWDAVHVPSDRSIVPLPGEAAPFPEINGLRASTYFISLFPTLQLNVTKDCAWWMRVMPDGPKTTTVTQGFLFPRATVARPDFEQLLEPYLNRWHLAVVEDNDISVNQQLASSSPHHRPGPYHNLEFAVHRFDNMVLDRVLKGVAEERMQEQERQQQMQDQHLQPQWEEHLDERQLAGQENLLPMASGTSLSAKQHFTSPAMGIGIGGAGASAGASAGESAGV